MDYTLYDACTAAINGIVQPIVENYNYLINVKRDPRTDDYFLVKSPGVLLTIIATYLYFSIKAGPRFMKDRKPMNLKYTLIIYNFVQVLFSIFLFHEGLQAGWGNDYKYSCQPMDWSTSPKTMRMVNAVWWYYMAKLSELLDTVFFILRKKNNQVTYLHLYHHVMMMICSWIGVKFLPGGHGTLLGVINAFIHIWMYSYYLVAALGPEYQKFLWWKRHLTEMQMVQFCIVFVHQFQVLFRECDYPKTLNFLLSIQAGYFFYLFSKFYIRTYTGKAKQPSTENNNIPIKKLKEY